ncbi:MAG: glycosyltransferase family 4 protein [Cyanobacteria bacterium]|nr:glycosyltransferase family 4 protein [Cyanobacteriota bacterium]
MTTPSSAFRRRLLLCNGDANDPSTWSNIPFFTLQAGMEAGLLHGGLSLCPERLRSRRRIWNLAQLLRTGKPGGYQYSGAYARRLMDQAALSDEPLALLSQYPLLPSHPWPCHWRVDFYIDATTRQVFGAYGMGKRIAPGLMRRVLERERLAYEAAGAVICMCQWAAESVINDYGIDAAKVHVLPGGGNLDEAVLARCPVAVPPPPPSLEHPLRLGFLGKEWERKGGPFLLELVDALATLGIPAVIRAIGPSPEQLPDHPALEPLGFIDKQTMTSRFVAELQSWHFGVLFSSAEAAPRSNLECLRLGIPVLAHAVGGIPSTVPDSGCGRVFPAQPPPLAVAHWIADRLTPYAGYLAWRDALRSRAPEFTWARAMESLQALLDPAGMP